MRPYIYRRAHAPTQDVAGRIVGMRNRTNMCTWTRCSHVHAHSLFTTPASIYQKISTPRHSLDICIPTYLHIRRETHTRAHTLISAHVGASVVHAQIGDAILHVERRTRAHAVQSRILSTRTRTHVYASVTPQHTRSYIRMRGVVHRYISIYTYL